MLDTPMDWPVGRMAPIHCTKRTAPPTQQGTPKAGPPPAKGGYQMSPATARPEKSMLSAVDLGRHAGINLGTTGAQGQQCQPSPHAATSPREAYCVCTLWLAH